MRIRKHVEWIVAVAAFFAAIASIVIALSSPPSGPARAANRLLRVESTSRSPEEGLDRRPTRDSESVVVRADESTPLTVVCRFEDGEPLQSGRVERHGVRIGEVASAGRAVLVLMPSQGEPLEVVSETGPVPARFEGGELIAMCGFFVAARCEHAGAESTRFTIERGSVDPRDRADWEAERVAGGVAPALDDLYVYSLIQRGEFEGDRFGPRFVACDLGDRRFRVSFARGSAAASVAISEPVAHGALLDLGPITLSRFGSLAIATESGEGLTLELSFSRVAPEGRAAPTDLLLARFDPAAFDAVHAGASLPLNDHRSSVVLSPLDPGELEVVLRRVDGPRLAPSRVMIEFERETTLVLDAAPLRDPAAFRLVLRFEPDGAPIAGARVSLSDPTGRHFVSASTDGDGACRFSDPATLGFATAPIIVVESFDETAPKRRFVAELPEPEPSGARLLSIPRRRELRAVGLTPPPGAPRERPLAYSVEIAWPGEVFAPYAVEEFQEGSDAITAFVTDVDAQYRFVAHYSAIFVQVSRPVAMLEADRRVETSFGPPELLPGFVRGRVVGRDGEGVPGTAVEATFGSCVPPEVVETDGYGRFVFGPVAADEIEVRANGTSRPVRAPFPEELVLELP